MQNQIVALVCFVAPQSERALGSRRGRIRGNSGEETNMTVISQTENAQSVQVVEADMLDRMNETNELIAQRAYEMYQYRGGRHGSDRDDWFGAEQEILPPLEVDRDVTESAVRLTAHVPGFDAKDLEVAIGHRRAVICGIHSGSNQPANTNREDTKVMRIVELPFDVDPVLATATLDRGMLEIVLPRSR
jgi:HSP20 family molecular chaperone IbpA